MAKLIPSGVVQLPNFAELQYNLNERERQKQLQFDEFSAQFDKKAGTYLDGDREAVQQSYGEVEKAMNALATDPDNVELRRKLREAYAGYNEVAGTAQFLADNYRQQWSAYNTNPDQFSLGGESAMDVFNRERTTKRDANQILSMASNPFTLMPKYKYDIESPAQVADKALEFIARDIKSFIKEDGTIDSNKVRSYAERYYDTRYIDPAQQKNAIVYEGVRQGVLGRNGEITSRSDLDIIDTEAFKPKGAELYNMFRDDFLSAVVNFAPKVAVDAYTRAKDRQDISLKRAQLNASRDKSKKNPYAGLTPVKVQGEVPKNYSPFDLPTSGDMPGFMIPIYENKIATEGGDIVKFGRIGGIPYIVQELTVEDENNEKIKKEVTRRATDVDLNMLNQVTNGLSSEYLKLPDNIVNIMSGQTSVSSQGPKVDPFGKPI
jgi:hypothetical protein